MNIAGKKWSLFTHHVDDTLGITHTHMVAGAIGGFMTGIFATVEGCYAFGITNPGGAIAGNGRQIWLQIVGALFIIGWNVVWTSLVMMFIKYVLRIPLRMSDEDLLIGDDAVHGEEAYYFFDDVVGQEPSPSAELHAMERMARMQASHKDPTVIMGRDVEEGNGGGSGDAPSKGKDEQEIKMD